MRTASAQRGPVLLVTAALLATLTACGQTSSAHDAGSTTTKADKDLQAQLPAAIAKRGTIRVGASADFPPDNFLASDQKTVIGYNADLLNAIAAKLGLRIAFTRTEFTGVITGIQAGRFDAGISFLDTKEREQAVNILDAYRVSESFITRSDYKGPAIPCGKRVGVGAGSAEALIIGDVSKSKCVEAGKPPIHPATYPSNPQAVVALTSQRVDAVFASTAPAAYAVKQSSGKLRLYGQPLNSGGYTGIAIAKDEPKLRDAMKAALESLMADGTYTRILKKWNVQGIASHQALLNAATD